MRFRLIAPVLGTFLMVGSMAIPAGSEDAAQDPAPEILESSRSGLNPRPIPGWDPASPQKLVRIEDRLYQRQGGRFFPAVEGRITVRLAADLEDWDALLAAAIHGAPQTVGDLSMLEPLRTNKLGIVDLKLPAGEDPVAWCALLHGTGLVRYAEIPTHGEYVATQNDPRYPEQWALHNTGQTGGTPGADIDAERAWDLTAGDPAIVVAILDSGTDIDHEDLAANVWNNPGEIAGNGVDDDANGYVDDHEGWDFDDDDNDPRSSNFHGTHVAGIILAAGSNGTGIAGIAGGLGGPGVRGMALSVGNSGPVSSVIDDAIIYAADNGADVITLSLSVGETQAINDALAYAYNTHDVFIDCASGNGGSSVGFPAVRPEVMAVGSTTDDDGSSGFSNPGPEVEVSAPGSDVLSTQLNDGYGTSSGTSFAAPYVAGVAALIRSRNPGLPAPLVRQLLIDTAEDVHDPGFDDRTGHGRINAFDAVSGATTTDGTVNLDAAAYACDATVGVTTTDTDLAGAGTWMVVVKSDTEPSGESVVLTEVGAASGVFIGTIPLSTGAVAADGMIQVIDGDTIVAEYLDADDGGGGMNVLKTDSAVIDCTAPIITGVGVSGVSNSGATVAWSTDENASTVVRYGIDLPPALSKSVAELTTTHSVILNGLEECATYGYSVESADAQGNLTVDDAGGDYFRFQTLGTFPGVGVIPCNQGQIELDRVDGYSCDATVSIAVTDIDLDTDPGLVETVQVLVVSTSEPSGEWVTLTEISSESSRFEGTVPLQPGVPVTGDGQIATSDGDLISATYHDADDGESGPFIATVSTFADCSGPEIGTVVVSEVSATRAVVSWSTKEPATSRIESGPTGALGRLAEDTTLKTAHSLPISGFDACSRAFFRISGIDAFGNMGVADVAGQPYELNLKQIGGLVYHETFETDTGWQLPGDWERGTPQGLGSDEADPIGAWSGDYSIGNDLSGLGLFPGDYEAGANASAISPEFSTRQERNLELIVRRKLGMNSQDDAGIYVLTSGADLVWGPSGGWHDTEWFQLTRDISAWADNKASVQLEFRLQSNGPNHSFGWNIDEIIIKDATEPDLLDCGGCAGAPTLAGVRSVHDPNPCGAGGLVVEWEAAPAWGTGTGGTYDVYRGTTPDFQPSALTVVATGLTGTSWIDSGAPIDTPVWYIVRARNDESCIGGEGLEDTNEVRLGATETTSQPLTQPVGDTLVTRPVGSAHVRVEWQPVVGADHYVIRRATLFDFSDAVEIGTTTSTIFEDLDAALGLEGYAYRVAAVDACGREE